MNAPATPPLSLAELVAEAEACRQLWAAVVERAMRDAASDGRDGEAARAWLAEPDALVLDLAGLESAAAAPRLAARLRGDAEPAQPVLPLTVTAKVKANQ